MADKKISQLTAASTPLTGSEVLPIVQNGATDQVSVANLTAGRAVSASSLTLTTTPLSVANGGTGLTSLTSGYIPYGNGTGAISSNSKLTFDGTNLSVTGRGYFGTGRNFITAFGANALITEGDNTSGLPIFCLVNNTTYNGNAPILNINISSDGTNIPTHSINTSGRPGNLSISSWAQSGGGGNILFSVGNTGAANNSVTFWASGGVSIGNTTDPGSTNLSVTGNIVQGTAAKGINFTANTAIGSGVSQLLNWYEEGYYTTTMTADTGTITLSYSRLNYTRVGRVVTVTGELVVNTLSSPAPTGDIYISLPFTAAASASQRSGRTSMPIGAAGVFTGTPTGVLTGYFDNAATTLRINTVTSYVGAAFAQYLAVGTTFTLCFTYQCQ